MANVIVIHFNFAIREGQCPELSDIITKSPYYSKYAKRLHSIDLNMVRAGVAKHPQKWIHSGYNEIQRPRQRYGIIDFKNLMALLQIEDSVDLKEAHREWIEEALKKSKVVRDSKWTQSIAVGDQSFLEQIKERLGLRAKGRKIHGSEDEYQLRERQTNYGDWQNLDNENTFEWNLAK